MNALFIQKTAAAMIENPHEYLRSCGKLQCLAWLNDADSHAVSGPVGCLEIIGKARAAIEAAIAQPA